MTDIILSSVHKYIHNSCSYVKPDGKKINKKINPLPLTAYFL